MLGWVGFLGLCNVSMSRLYSECYEISVHGEIRRLNWCSLAIAVLCGLSGVAAAEYA